MKTLLARTTLIVAALTGTAGMANDVVDPAALRSLIDDGQGSVVVSQMETRLKSHPASAEVHYWLAEGKLAQIDAASSFRKLSLARAAKKHLLATLELAPNHVDAHRSLGQYYLQAPAIAGGSNKKAKLQSDALMELDKAAALRLKADIAQEEDDPQSAIAFNRQALSAGTWDWDAQYALVIEAVHYQVESAAGVLEEAERNVRQHANQDDRALRLIDYQRGKHAAVSGQILSAGQASLTRYLAYQPLPEDPSLDWAEFRLAQVERQSGQTSAAKRRLARLEATDVTEDLGFALQDERRWHYAD